MTHYKKYFSKKYLIPVVISGLLISSGYIVSTQAVNLAENNKPHSVVKKMQPETKQTEDLSIESTENFSIASAEPVNIPQEDQQQADKQPETTDVSTVVKQSEIPETAAVQKKIVSRNSSTSSNAALPWFGQAEKIFSIGSVAKVTDVATGLNFKVKRTYGYNHADVETLTLEDTKILKQIYGGSWSWERRAVIVEINGQKIAASMAGMPHAGRDDQPANVNVSNRSVGYGYGVNLDAIKGNGMDGHFDIHFLGSKTHGSNKVDSQHQAKVREAAKAIR
ncbi:MAG: hypothetical protein JG777_1450 [Clostridia bacterium]|jgi:hypothetical protein|uniref:hypothetical protein n=1 Tax=Petroclostridium xylanilyticum TaxID=1792311 RepID=UPI000B98922E|nr:hypothetical protein [Petroclostridium xylanilyticum]MBZ4645961.1 hypothetical protein [Clostridia bacterium]